MTVEPSAPKSGPPQSDVFRAGIGWLLILVLVAIGFGVGSRIGLAEHSEGQPGNEGSLAAVSANAPNQLGARAKTSDRNIDPVTTSRRDQTAARTRTPGANRIEGPGEFEDDFYVDAPGGYVGAAGPGGSGRVGDRSASPSELDLDLGVGSDPDYRLEALDTMPLSASLQHHGDAAGSSGAARAHGGAARNGAVPIERLPIYRADDPATSTESLTIVTRGVIGKGDSLGSSLRAQKISAQTVHLIAAEMRKVFDFRHSRKGDKYRLGQDTDGRVLDFRYSQSPEESYYLAWEGTRYVVRKETAELRAELSKIAGVVDSSFYGAVLALGERSSLASDFAQILAWDIDFSRSVHPGDEFQILYERLYRVNDDGDDEYVKPGRILAGRYVGRTGEHTVVYFEEDDGTGAYFRPDGTSVERAFLVAPLEFSRITSRFTWARRHPILKVTRPHPGIDYAAPRGTPIWAVADGVVEYKARAGASGNLVRVRHKNGLTSHYAHLASFAKGLEVGDRVEQKEVIGYVGSTGLSTGPHVCFRVKRDGRYVDPMKISGPAGDPVEPNHLAAFHSVRDQLLADLRSGPLSAADEAL